MQALEVKRAALKVRREIEVLATDFWASASALPREGMAKTAIERRLVLIVASVPPESRRNAFKAARQAGYVYKETSDVLHGRTRASWINAVRVREWNSDVARLTAIVASLS
ncbi:MULTISPECIES: hypothetical protein [Clavibacter]|uniref:Uncharacterized protein n=1 Tax=Clavibacter seminis TaxID=2860285 RepID=A0ABY3T944_9MICO|nr:MULTISPECIES: hypothetical protein [Clavibacter]UKF25806.1 hypothetical protein KYT88_03645 [Clavibacter sp. A6099]